ncbi:hypothetical protein QBC37DRAFT_443717 [Rhypophila decipiens]|uniref:Uncharacterized protein n=1 Tax=Rhypophila decipiens TaxID=261697 RepID=A0AAN6Y063_9PEZI|nr:hypothetical protein QBC37DRAFT_443717 [Rhypophila decipiens]
MMRRPLPTGSGLLPCQICGLITRQQNTVVRSAKRSFVTLDAGRRLAKLPQTPISSPIQSRLFSTSPSWLKMKRPGASKSPSDTARFAQSSASEASLSAEKDLSSQQQIQPAELADLAAAVDRVTKTFVAQEGIPSEHMTLTALQACTQAAGKLPLDTAHPPVTSKKSQNQSLNLLELDTNGRKGGDGSDIKSQINGLADKISGAAYSIISHPPVVITPQLLQKYIALQARLGRPESLPQVLELFASKPTPRLISGSIRYTERNPDSMKNATEPEVTEAAIDAAVAARNLDAAIGIVENTYGAKPFKQSKLVSRALLPGIIAGSAPIGIYLIATRVAHIQEAFDQGIFTMVAFAGIFTYYVCTGSLGLIAMGTFNDHMKRVSWAEGIPLWERWLREEERAAYDKIACSFGFSDELRAGEEEGEEFESLREFMLHRGMILDKVNLMPGMS